MRLRSLVVPIVALIAFLSLAPVAALASTTPTEAAATAAAKADHTAYTLSPEKTAKAIELSHFYDTLYFVRDGWGILSLFLILHLGIAARIRNVTENLSGHRWVQGPAFAALFLLTYTLANLPVLMLGHWKSFKEGFSVEHWGPWLGDQGKTFVVDGLMLSLFVMLLFWIIRKFPRRWWLWLWFPSVLIAGFATYVTPLWIDPLYHKFEPLSQSNPALVEQIEKIAQHAGIDVPRERMFVMKASAKTTLLNAYVTGFGSSKRLVVWDTTIKKATPDEIALLAGHEMGHYVLGHIVRGMVLGFVGMLAAFFVAFRVFQWLLRRCGARWGIRSQDDWAALALMFLVMSVLFFLSTPIQNAFSRGIEQDADIFGLEAVHGIIADPQATGQAEFQLLGENQLLETEPNAFVEFWTDSHPSIPFRAAFAKHYDPWVPGAEPKFFKK